MAACGKLIRAYICIYGSKKVNKLEDFFVNINDIPDVYLASGISSTGGK